MTTSIDDLLADAALHLDRATVEKYIARAWLRPMRRESGWVFEEIDVARLRLVDHLTRDMAINDDGIDIVLSLLDQLYTARSGMHRLSHAIARQPSPVRTEIMVLFENVDGDTGAA